MKRIPETNDALVLRTDFSDEPAWTRLCEAIRQPVVGFRPYVEFVSDPDFDGLAADQLLSIVPPHYNHSFLFLVDGMALSRPEHPVLVIDLFSEPGRTFRVIPSEMWGIENNLSIANMHFAEFADSIDADGIFRGFPPG